MHKCSWRAEIFTSRGECRIFTQISFSLSHSPAIVSILFCIREHLSRKKSFFFQLRCSFTNRNIYQVSNRENNKDCSKYVHYFIANISTLSAIPFTEDGSPFCATRSKVIFMAQPRAFFKLLLWHKVDIFQLATNKQTNKQTNECNKNKQGNNLEPNHNNVKRQHCPLVI